MGDRADSAAGKAANSDSDSGSSAVIVILVVLAVCGCCFVGILVYRRQRKYECTQCGAKFDSEDKREQHYRDTPCAGKNLTQLAKLADDKVPVP